VDSRPTLEVNIEPDRSRVVVVVSGEVDVASIPSLEETVLALRESGWDEIVLDLRPLTFLDSTGLSWLLGLNRDALERHWRLSLVDGSPAVSRLLELTGLRSHFAWTKR
jgi:anti-sigma B factor antagonist